MKPRLVYKFTKRFFDLFMSFFGIIFLSPIFLFIAILVKFTSAGTILYKGERTGLFGKSFKILKFRTMVMNAELGAGTTSRNDTRVTFVGRRLRRYKLDELPQLFNIFFGDMSFVGPRPELQKYTRQYQGEEKLILSVRPGITDFSSVKFSNLNELIDDDNPDASFEERVLPEKNKLRLQYVNECNFWLDMKLILLTLLRVIGIK
jgi:lipopolysaccharide/colanic/teichoic acid biosynthesis glycosyltransferase